jgi:AbrB family looped-hinge helix DNA binding protein
MSHTAKVSTKGQIVIPGSLRKKHKLAPGSKVDVFEYGEMICIAPRVAEPIDAAWGMLPPTPSLADELSRDRQKDEEK